MTNDTAYMLCGDKDSTETLLVSSPVRQDATLAVKTAITADAASLTANTLNEISGPVSTVKLPTAGTQGDAVTIFNATLHAVTVQNGAATADLEVLAPAGVTTYLYDNGMWLKY